MSFIHLQFRYFKISFSCSHRDFGKKVFYGFLKYQCIMYECHILLKVIARKAKEKNFSNLSLKLHTSLTIIEQKKKYLQELKPRISGI